MWVQGVTTIFACFSLETHCPKGLEAKETTIVQIKAYVVREKAEKEDSEQNLKNFNGEIPKIKRWTFDLENERNQETINPSLN